MLDNICKKLNSLFIYNHVSQHFVSTYVIEVLVDI